MHPLLDERVRDDVSTFELLRPSEATGSLVLRGQVDRRNCGSLVASLGTADWQTDEVRLDLSQLAFIDVAGMRAIRELSEQLEDQGRRLTLIGPRAPVRHLIEMLGIDRTLSIGEAAP